MRFFHCHSDTKADQIICTGPSAQLKKNICEQLREIIVVDNHDTPSISTTDLESPALGKINSHSLPKPRPGGVPRSCG